MKIVATIEARMASTRLPGKVLLPLAGKPALQVMIERVRRARYIDDIIVATTTNAEDSKIEALCRTLGVKCHRGSEEDVLSRVLDAAKAFGGDLICELTGDCPLIDPIIIDQVVTAHLSGTYDYTANVFNQRTYPRGLDVQVFPTAVLEKVSSLTSDPIDRVHVSYFIYMNPKIFTLNGIYAHAEVFGPDLRITLDTEEDYALIKGIFEHFSSRGTDFPAKDVVKLLREDAALRDLNRNVRQKAVQQG